ncbi:cardiolipin synthase [Haloferula sp. A504]|uniref:cardiolipin synthase n=1 Tax=Haloferula sp. A504 TaxID=3373601 RepID=UPI0031C67F08|nr:cardiolipin synthase [Verrucomicrobiaceae bacterium E54]
MRVGHQCRQWIARHDKLDRIWRFLGRHRRKLTGCFVLVAHLLGALTSVKAIMETRTSQGAIAWAISLNTIPYVAVPAYWVFGRSNFNGYVTARRTERRHFEEFWDDFSARLMERDLIATPERKGPFVTEQLASLPATSGNDAELLVDGDETFPSILEGIARAKHYVLVQFYIVRDDPTGRELKDALIAKANAGVRCLFLYDEIGSRLPDSYLDPLVAAGVQVRPFNTTQGDANRFQINFRNHRKIVVVDGTEAWVGGLNVGDEYKGLDPEVGFWRDTHMRVEGPVVQSVQVSFAEDWYWAAREILDELNWDPQRAASGENKRMLCLPSGPVDPLETCTLFFLHAINEAEERLWIASPYFVPDPQFISALQLAALRGVEVRILIPDEGDSTMVDLSAWSFLPELHDAGIEVYRYTKGFMHHKVVVIDDRYCTIGTANFDNRSFRLNFEITMGVDDEAFTAEVAEMLEEDFANSRQVAVGEFDDKSAWFRFWARVSRLAAPVQ